MQISKKWIRNLAILVYIDLLFFPYFQTVIMPFSLPVVGIVIATGKMKFPYLFKRFFFLVATLMLFSLLFGYFLPQSAPYIVENFKRIIQFLSSFVYLIFFFCVARQHKIEKHLRTISLIFIAYFSMLAAWSFFDPELVRGTIENIYGRLVISESVYLQHLRFSYIFNDPNTAGYFLMIAVLPWFPFWESMTVRSILVYFCFANAFLIQSRGAMLSLALALLLWVFPRDWVRLKIRKMDVWNILRISAAFLVVSSIVIFVFFPTIAPVIVDNKIFGFGSERLSTSQYDEGTGIRFDIWQGYTTSLLPLPIGIGYMFKIQGREFFPHSDLLRFTYSYGFIAAGLFVRWFLRSSFHYPLIFIPALVPFMINSLIDEQKLFGLFLATLGVLLGINQRWQSSL